MGKAWRPTAQDVGVTYALVLGRVGAESTRQTAPRVETVNGVGRGEESRAEQSQRVCAFSSTFLPSFWDRASLLSLLRPWASVPRLPFVVRHGSDAVSQKPAERFAGKGEERRRRWRHGSSLARAHRQTDTRKGAGPRRKAKQNQEERWSGASIIAVSLWSLALWRHPSATLFCFFVFWGLGLWPWWLMVVLLVLSLCHFDEKASSPALPCGY